MSTLHFRKITTPDQPKVLVAKAVPDQEQTPAVAPTVVDQVESDEVSAPDHTLLPALTSKFLLAGKAIFTVSNGKGDHYTFKIRRVESEFPMGSGRMRVTYFVNVKATGGTWPYRYVGLLNQTTGGIKCTAKSEFLPGTKEYNVAVWACSTVLESKCIPEGYKIEHAGQCGKCGKQLTDPVSIERGIGPDCWERMQ